ncbi:MAG TPA: aminoglycoside phosphotransferase family protein [Trebonia sp.]|nr:aminoglycoside phosphotransferase family protein [Trebonia sp.]
MAHAMPAADVEVDAGLVRELLAEQHPDLAGLPISFLAGGWDNTLFRLGDSLVVRLPRREVGARIIVGEQRWLPLLAPRLPIKIPVPERIGQSSALYPYGWSVVPYLPGVTAADAARSLDLAVVARQLAEFFGALHLPAPPDAPVNPYRGVPLARGAERLEANLAIAALSPDTDVLLAGESAIRRSWADALAAPAHPGPPAWLHGDAHPANILVDGGVISGVIDFGDITSGDPACDLSIAWKLLPLDWHPAFRAAYLKAGAGAGDDGLWRRARGWALSQALLFLAHSADNPQLYRVGEQTLARVLAG